jgi:hypothetical protein
MRSRFKDRNAALAGLLANTLFMAFRGAGLDPTHMLDACSKPR